MLQNTHAMPLQVIWFRILVGIPSLSQFRVSYNNNIIIVPYWYYMNISFQCRAKRYHDTCSELFLYAVPAPSHVILRQNKINPIRPVGSNVTLTCTVELPSTVATATAQLIVDIQLADPAGNTLSGGSSMQVFVSTYISRATITSFERHHSGIYTCEATISSNSPYLSESSHISEEILLHSGKLHNMADI